MSNKHTQKIIEAYRAGVLNKYMANKLIGIVESGVNDDLCDELIVDAQDASTAGVHSDDDYNAYFFAGTLSDDILKDTFGMKVSPAEKKELCRFILANKDADDYKLNDLTDYRLLIHKWLCDRLDKRAYPNTEGMHKQQIKYDINKWVDTLKNVYTDLHSNAKLARRDAIDKNTLEWDPDEVQKFDNWMRYYEESTPEKYNVKSAQLVLTKEAYDPMPVPSAWLNNPNRSNMPPSMSTHAPDETQTKREMELQRAIDIKRKMHSRLDSIRRLIRGYKKILPSQDLNNLYDVLFSLEKSISQLNAYASIEDCIVRSANQMKHLGFDEGADILYKVAQDEPGVVGALPPGESPQPNLPQGSPVQVNLTLVINRLEGLSKTLKSRDTIRELASIDILLNEMGMASYFPELTDAQAKLIESFGYASNKIESIIAKMRGSGATKATTQPIPQAQAPTLPAPPKPQKAIDTGELMTKPVGEVRTTLPTAPKR